MMRGTRFWLRYYLETMGIGFGVGAVMLILNGLGAGREVLSGVLASTPYYIAMGCALAIMMVCFSTHILYIPLVLSLGSTRREVYLGFLLYRICSALTPLLAALLIWLPLPGEIAESGRALLPTIGLLLLYAVTAGSLMGAVYQKLRVLGLILLVNICGDVGGSVGLLMSMNEAGGNLFSQIFGWMDQWSLVGLILGILMAAADLIVTFVLLKRREVKL